jgi:eukaryotic-like serine/threonine-protein kinase
VNSQSAGYRVEYEIGRGGMGVVLRAYDIRPNRVVALKMLPSNTTHDSELCRRLAAEDHAASALSHPGIASVYDFVEQGGGSFIVYEYVHGPTWRKELDRARFTVDEILDASCSSPKCYLA